MNNLICAGGSGARVLESLLHLCAAGLGPDKLRVLFIDTDKSNGNFTRVKEVITAYKDCRKYFVKQGGSNHGLFKTELDLFSGGNNPSVWEPINSNDTLKNLLNYNNLDATNTTQDIARLFWTEEELDTKLDKGFKGHPTIGAPAMSLVSLYQETEPWRTLFREIDLDSQAGGSSIMLVGSVFGGTGASAIYPIGRFIKEKCSKLRVKIGALALVPYFCFISSKEEERAEMAAKSEWFTSATRAAVEFYEYLRKQPDIWPFHHFYWAGDVVLKPVTYSIGGEDQQNPAHFVDMLGALACLEFFSQEILPPAETGGCYYCGPGDAIEPSKDNFNPVAWNTLPFSSEAKRSEFKKSLLSLLSIDLVHLGFNEEILCPPKPGVMIDVDSHPERVPWYYTYFAKNKDWLTDTDSAKSLQKLSDFFRLHNIWWHQVQNSSNVMLINSGALKVSPNSKGIDKSNGVDLDQLANLEYPSNMAKVGIEHFNDFYSRMTIPKNEFKGAACKGEELYLTLMKKAADSFLQKHYGL